MLTKNQLKHTIRQGKVHPKFIAPSEGALLDLAEQMADKFASGIGQTLQELEDSLQSVSKVPVFEGFKKLLEDNCEFSDDGFESIEDHRWFLFKKSKEIRSQLPKTANITDFYRQMNPNSTSIVDLKSNLYADLPHCRKIKNFKRPSPIELVNRYNCSQIQGLLLHAKEIHCEIDGLNLVQKRRLVQKIRFHGLLMDAGSSLGMEESHTFSFKLSGPLNIFDGASTYGSRLANFFPHLLHFKKWTLKASLKLNQKVLDLEIDSKKKIESHYQDLTGYVPEEFSVLLENINKKSNDFKASLGDEYLHLGEKNYCFPDFILTHKKKIFYLEIFHKWHSSPLKQRLSLLQKTPNKSLIVAVSKSLLKDPLIKRSVELCEGIGVKVFSYSSFPTAKAVLTYLS